MLPLVNPLYNSLFFRNLLGIIGYYGLTLLEYKYSNT